MMITLGNIGVRNLKEMAKIYTVMSSDEYVARFGRFDIADVIYLGEVKNPMEKRSRREKYEVACFAVVTSKGVVDGVYVSDELEKEKARNLLHELMWRYSRNTDTIYIPKEYVGWGHDFLNDINFRGGYVSEGKHKGTYKYTGYNHVSEPYAADTGEE